MQSFSETGNLRDLQREVSEWSQKNFGEVPAWMPLLGVCEELGELTAAYAEWDTQLDEVADAAADTVVFLANFCGRYDASLSKCAETYGYNMATTADCDFVTIADLMAFVGKTQHHFLKQAQGIRNQENHRFEIMVCVGRIYNAVSAVCDYLGMDLIEETQKTWTEVQKRDWKKNPETAHLDG